MAGLAQQVENWLLRAALGKPSVETIFEKLCSRLTGIGIPIARARLNWPTLHPLFRAEMVKWQRDTGAAELEHFHHQDTNSDAWQKSPLRYMLETDLPVLRRRLSGKGKLLDFALFEELAEQGYTDYIAFKTEFSRPGVYLDDRISGIFVIWATDRQTGFTDEDISVLQEIQLTFALVCKSIIQTQITGNIVETYLGPQAGRSVLEGNIRLGDGATTRALVWYSDLRNSTRLTGSLPSEEFLKLLNVYFECAARPAIKAGGDVLAFIGDAVLVIFPINAETDMCALAKGAIEGVAESFRMRDAANARRRAEGLEQIDFGIGLNIGDVVFGNIGVPERLAFTVIGSTVTEVERIEKLTKTMQPNVLATGEVAALMPNRWMSVGTHALNGVEHPVELFTPIGMEAPRLRIAAE
ncbi:adenylate/guanylate cyclase domain-containing protein [Aurantimonas sp. VKM B-3413]|uniref:adenylate/guanylate cyclase domain-containing protein n=1 Tax=Aurantimonas sp. VKM B-3413 TaxID=2779401 RepID=UPI001E50745A|nr:adenylate/guanylate cyclase domain-containing protein [Aurantimonas sp. VKM B-3413]MCB8836725.1 adenylate/guanylate cyclase domain-containing protein [Aurantimonas sp. VKM B-3413]